MDVKSTDKHTPEKRPVKPLNKFLFMMVVVLLLISVTSTYIMFNMVATVPEAPVTGSGEVKLTINNPNVQRAPEVNSGVVTLRVLPSG